MRESLDAYIHGLYRSLKCVRNGNMLGARLEAAVSVPALLTFLFAFEGRHAPFPGYLERELTHYPLVRLPLPTGTLLSLIDQMLAAADVVAQQTLLQIVDAMAREDGLGDVLAAWDDGYLWMHSFTSES